ncbi:MAG TPA: c-type cytochrome [Burkholderiales bacterium]|nr:c-type cytochrome [Burkholderiales bacterium]
MSTHDEHSSFIKTPQQLVVVVVLAFVVPISMILLLVGLVLNKASVDPAALTPDAVAKRIQPVGRVEFGAAGGAAAGARTGEEIVKQACGACHIPGVANAPKIGDKAAWGKLARDGLPTLMKVASSGKGAMPPRGGVADLTDEELARAIVYMANESGANLKVPAAAAARKK